MNVKAPPGALIVRLSPALSCRTRPEPVKPVTVPPIEAVPTVQVIATAVTLAVAVPVPPDIVHVCVGVGGLKTVTA